MRSWIRKLDFRIEEAILVILIILETMDFLEVIPTDFEFIEKIVSWTALGLLLYQASLSKIFFGNRSKQLDIAIVISYFVLIANKMVGYAISAVGEEKAYVVSFFRLTVENASEINYYSFMAGALLILVISLSVASKLRLHAPSVISIFHEEGYPERQKLLKRFFLAFLILNVFFIAVFNLMSEWLAIAVDAPIFLIVVLIYLFYFVRHRSKFKVESAIYKISSMAENFYEEFIKHFKHRSTLLLGLGGMLVLHLLTDVANFVFPYVLTFRDPIYFSRLEGGYAPLITFLKADLLNRSIVDSVSISFVYIMNLLALVLLLIMPAVLWYLIYSEKSVRISKKHLVLFGLSLPSFLAAPAFVFKRLGMESLAGVDIQSISAVSGNANISYVLLFSVVAAMLVFALSYFRKIEKYIILLFIIISQYFFGMYVYYYFADILQIYLDGLAYFFSIQNYFSFCYFGLFLIITAAFYIGGFMFFEYELIKKLKHYIKF